MNKRTAVRRPVWIAALSLLLALGCSGPGAKAPAQKKRPVIGVTLLTQTHDFFKDLEAGLRKEAEARGIDVVITACEMDPAKQASQIEDFVAQHVDALIIAPCDSAAVVANLGGPERAGIPVFTVDIAARGGKVVSHVASDNVQGRRLAGQAMARFTGG